MSQDKDGPSWHKYVAVSTAIISVLAAVASLQASSYSSLMLREKNNSILFQNKANKEWNGYFAIDIVRQIKSKKSAASKEQQEFQKRAEVFEGQAASDTDKFQAYFERNSNLVMAGTLLEIAIALSAMSLIIKQKLFWGASILLACVGLYFLFIGLV